MTTTPSTAVYAMADATSSLRAPTTGASAAMAELPQIALPQATSNACTGDRPSARPIATAGDDRGHDDADDRRDERQAGPDELLEVGAESEQDDGELQQQAGGERDARRETIGWRPDGAHHRPDEDRQDDGLERRVARWRP